MFFLTLVFFFEGNTLDFWKVLGEIFSFFFFFKEIDVFFWKVLGELEL